MAASHQLRPSIPITVSVLDVKCQPCMTFSDTHSTHMQFTVMSTHWFMAQAVLSFVYTACSIVA